MVFKNFYIALIVRLIVVLSLMMLLSMVIFRTERLFTVIFIGIALVVSITDLLFFISKTNRDISAFFEAVVKTGDTTTFLKKMQGARYKDLYTSFEKVADAIQHARLEKQAYYHFIEEVLTGIDTGIVIYNQQKVITYINESGKEIIAAIGTQDKLDSLLNISAGERHTVNLSRNETEEVYSIRCNQIKVKNQEYRIYNLQNIRYEMEEKETEAWQKLIRVMAHEIMNSITPITSLSESSLEILRKDNKIKIPSEMSDKEMQKIADALATIEQRGSGLHHFVNQYRKLAHVPAPKFSMITGNLLAKAAKILMEQECTRHNIKMIIDLHHEEVKFKGDLKLLEQVLINLVNNSIESLSTTTHGIVKLTDRLYKNKTYSFIVEDNGNGIEKEALQKIFIPFYSTKPNGSGIGLAVSRQIMQAHKGDLQAFSRTGNQTRFVMSFPC